MNESKAKTGHKLIAIIAAVIIAFTMYTPLAAFADDDAQAQNAGAAKAQTAETNAGGETADEDKGSDAGSDDADAEKEDADADRQDADDADSGSDDENANAGNAKAGSDADGTDLDADSSDEDTEADSKDTEASEDLDENADLDEEIAGTLVNTDTAYRVTVTFGEEAGIPEGAELVVKEIPEADYLDQATAELDAGKVAFAVFLDISIVKDGEEIQPSDDVKVEVTLNDMPSDENGELAVVHFENENNAEAVKSNTENATTEFKADGFSVYGFVYTVEFTHGEYTFVIEGGSEILLSEIFSQLHIEEDLTGSEAECSAPELFQIDAISEAGVVTDWNLKSLEPFTTEETLTVNLASGDVVMITLTDDQPIARGNANPSGNVIWELYERGDEKVMEFKVLDLNASDEKKAITKIQKQGSTARIANEDPLRTETDKIIIHDGITGIGWTALYDTSGYKPLFPNYSRDREQAGVFQDFWILKTVEIEDPSDIQRIGWSAFRRTYKLESIDLSSMTNLTEILNQAFAPSGLEELDLSGCTSLELIGHGICSGAKFEDKQMLTSVKLPKNLKTIGSEAFTKCRKLKYVSFEDISSVENVYELAFAGENNNVLNPIEYIADEKTKQKAVLRQAAKDLFSNVANLPDNIVNYTALDKYEPDIYWQLTLDVKDKTVPYSGSKQYGYEVEGVTGSGDDTCSVSGLQSGHVLSVEYDDPSTPSYGTNAAEYDNGSFENAGYKMMYGGYNYAINYQVSATPGKLTITPVDLMITAKNQDYTYNGSPQGPAGTYTSGFDTYVRAEGLQGDDALTSITLSGQETKAGEYPDEIEPSAAAVGEATDNYDITYVAGKLTIDKADLKITAKDKEYTYNGRAQGPAGTYTSGFDTYVETSGLKGNDVLTSITLSGQETNAGVYPDEIVPSAAAVGEATNNYTITYADGTLTITPIEATVTIVGHKGTKRYNSAQQSVAGYDFSTDSNLYTRNDFAFSGTANASRTDAGTTRMGLASSQFQNTNRNFSKVTFNVTDGSIEITKRSLTITTGSASKRYDGSALTSNKYTVSGLASGDTIAVTTTGSRTAVGSSENTYTIRWGNTKKSNYNITEKLGTLTVDDAGNNSGGGGGNNGGNNAPGGNANAGAASANGPAANIADGDVPMADGTTIDDDPTPTAAPEDGSFWALLNLLMTLLTILIAILWIVLRRPEAVASIRAGVVIVIALAILSVIVLILTEDFTQPIHIVDKWTPLMGLILALEAATAGVLNRKKAANQE